MTYKIKGVDVEKYAFYVNKLRQNVGLETWKWRHIVTSQTAHTKYKWPPYDLEPKLPAWKFSSYATAYRTYIKMFLSCAAQPFEMQRNTERQYKLLKGVCDACVENRPALRRMLHFFRTMKQLKTKHLWHSNNGQEVKHITYNPCASFTAD